MSERPTVTVPNEIEEARQQLEDWRRGRTGRERIPESLWSKAVELGRQYGLWRTARALRLDYARLKGRADAGGQGSEMKSRPAFVELIPQAGGICECVVEMENARGARMRIELKGGVPDVAAWSRAFWGERV